MHASKNATLNDNRFKIFDIAVSKPSLCISFSIYTRRDNDTRRLVSVLGAARTTSITSLEHTRSEHARLSTSTSRKSTDPHAELFKMNCCQTMCMYMHGRLNSTAPEQCTRQLVTSRRTDIRNSVRSKYFWACFVCRSVINIGILESVGVDLNSWWCVRSCCKYSVLINSLSNVVRLMKYFDSLLLQ